MKVRRVEGSGLKAAAPARLQLSAFVLVLAVACAAPAAPAPAPLPTFTPVPTPPVGGLYVDARQDLGSINPLVYGTNYGPAYFVPMQMQPKVKEAGLTFMRFPGGNWGDQADVEAWQVDQYLAFARQMGWEVSISTRLRGGTPEKAAALVKLVNITKDYRVRYWSVGNEPNLYEGSYDVAQFNAEWRQWAEAMRAADPTIKLVGPDTNQFVAHPDNPDHQKAYDWLAEFLKANGDLVDVVSVHRYPFPKLKSDPPPTIDQLRATSREWDENIPALRALIREQIGRDLPIAVMEVNSSWASYTGGEASLDSHYNAIWWGDSLGRMIRQGVDIVAQFTLIGESGLMDKYETYPIYQVYRMYQRFGVERVYASSDDPDISIFAAKRTDGALTLMIVNLASGPVEKNLTIADAGGPASAETWLFDQEHKAEQVDPTMLGAPATLRLPPESMTLLVVPQP